MMEEEWGRCGGDGGANNLMKLRGRYQAAKVGDSLGRWHDRG